MIEALISLLVVLIVAGIVGAILMYIVGLLPIDATFKQIATIIVWLLVALIVLMRALPLLGVSI